MLLEVRRSPLFFNRLSSQSPHSDTDTIACIASSCSLKMPTGQVILAKERHRHDLAGNSFSLLMASTSCLSFCSTRCFSLLGFADQRDEGCMHKMPQRHDLVRYGTHHIGDA